ncbi:MAG: hypothetical protein AAF616_05935 [Bacteroidota bacterium]
METKISHRYRLVLFVMTSLILMVSGAQERTADELLTEGLKKYKAKSGKINYVISGDAKGEEILAFDAHGWTSMRMQTMIFKLYGLQTMQTLHEVRDGDWVYLINEGDSTFRRKKDFKWSQQAAYKDPAAVSEAVLFSLGGVQSADSLLLNKTCQVWTFENKALQELWIWEGLVMKRKTKLGKQNVVVTATEMSIDVEPDPSVFTVPDYLKLVNE